MTICMLKWNPLLQQPIVTEVLGAACITVQISIHVPIRVKKDLSSPTSAVFSAWNTNATEHGTDTDKRARWSEPHSSFPSACSTCTLHVSSGAGRSWEVTGTSRARSLHRPNLLSVLPNSSANDSRRLS